MPVVRASAIHAAAGIESSPSPRTMYARENASDSQLGAGATSHTLSMRVWKFLISLPKKNAFGNGSFSIDTGSIITRIAELSGERIQRMRERSPYVPWFTLVALTTGAAREIVVSVAVPADLSDTSTHAVATTAPSVRRRSLISFICVTSGRSGEKRPESSAAD